MSLVSCERDNSDPPDSVSCPPNQSRVYRMSCAIISSGGPDLFIECCWLWIVAEEFPGTCEIFRGGCSISGSIVRGSQPQPIGISATPLMAGCCQSASGILTKGSYPHYTAEILVFEEELLWRNCACSIKRRSRQR